MPSALSSETVKQATQPMRRTPPKHQQNARFPYGHPYYNSPYEAAYQRQIGRHDYISPYMAAYWEQFGYTQPASAYSGYQSK